jgi:hypothetical protein
MLGNFMNDDIMDSQSSKVDTHLRAPLWRSLSKSCASSFKGYREIWQLQLFLQKSLKLAFTTAQTYTYKNVSLKSRNFMA